MFPRSSTYRVRRGDSLWKIAKVQYGKATLWPEIAKANGIPKSNIILIGMQLRIPPVGASGPPKPFEATPSTRMPRPRTDPTPRFESDLDAEDPTPLAKAVAWPSVKYSFKFLPPIKVDTPTAEFKLTFTGEVSLSKEGVMTEVGFLEGGHVSGSLKSEYDQKFVKLASDATIEYDPKKRVATVSCSYTVTPKGKGMASTQVAFQPPDTLICSVSPEPIKGEKAGFEFEGKMGYELEVKLKRTQNPTNAFEPVRVYVQEHQTVLKEIAIGGMYLAGVGIIVADLVKDGATLGAGTVESPLSFAAALQLFRGANAMRLALAVARRPLRRREPGEYCRHRFVGFRKSLLPLSRLGRPRYV